MAAGEERRKLLCQCGKPLGIFTAEGPRAVLPVLQGDHHGALYARGPSGGDRVRGETTTPGAPARQRCTEVNDSVWKNGH
jgi:hypothetical protein